MHFFSLKKNNKMMLFFFFFYPLKYYQKRKPEHLEISHRGIHSRLGSSSLMHETCILQTRPANRQAVHIKSEMFTFKIRFKDYTFTQKLCSLKKEVYNHVVIIETDTTLNSSHDMFKQN